MYSRIAWFVAALLWLWYAGGFWYEALRDGFSALKTVQVVLVTGLAAAFAGSFVVNRGWRKPDDDAH